MDLRNRPGLKNAARNALAQSSYDPRKLILIHTGVSTGLMLLLVTVNFILGQQIDSTGGLSGIGLRSILSTVQALLELVQLVVFPFWELGIIYAALKIARQEPTSPATLLQGFRRWGPVFRVMLLRGLIYMGIAFAALYFGMQIFLFTPAAATLMETLTPYLSDTAVLEGTAVLDEAAAAAITDAYLPVLLIFAVLYIAALIPIVYWFRMTDYVLLDEPKTGAFAAMRQSRQMMRYNCFDLLKLDFSFWWYYLLQLLLSVVCYGDVLLNILGVPLPWSGDVSFFLFYILFLIGQVALFFFTRNRVEVTYAMAYESIRPRKPGEE